MSLRVDWILIQDGLKEEGIASCQPELVLHGLAKADLSNVGGV
jgi:hypothetical protein